MDSGNVAVLLAALGISISGIGAGIKFFVSAFVSMTNENQDAMQRWQESQRHNIELTARVSQLETEVKQLTLTIVTQNSVMEELQRKLSRYENINTKSTVA